MFEREMNLYTTDICHIWSNNEHTCRISKAFFGLISLCQVNGSLNVAMVITQGMATASSIYQLITITEMWKRRRWWRQRWGGIVKTETQKVIWEVQKKMECEEGGKYDLNTLYSCIKLPKKIYMFSLIMWNVSLKKALRL